MNARIRLLGVALIVALALLSCESVFTTSVFTFLQRDPSRLSPEQQVAYAEDVLVSGTPEQQAEMYELLKDSDDPEVQLLAADLALASVQLEQTLLDAVSSGDPAAAIEAAIAELTADELERMAQAAALLDAADDTLDPTPEQYFFSAAALVAVAANENGGTAGLDALGPADDGYDEVEQAKVFLDAAAAALTASGESTDLLDSIDGLVRP